MAAHRYGRELYEALAEAVAQGGETPAIAERVVWFATFAASARIPLVLPGGSWPVKVKDVAARVESLRTGARMTYNHKSFGWVIAESMREGWRRFRPFYMQWQEAVENVPLGKVALAVLDGLETMAEKWLAEPLGLCRPTAESVARARQRADARMVIADGPKAEAEPAILGCEDTELLAEIASGKVRGKWRADALAARIAALDTAGPAADKKAGARKEAAK